MSQYLNTPRPNYNPIHNGISPSGFTISASFQTNLGNKESIATYPMLCKLADEILGDSSKMAIIAERVYQYMLMDLYLTQERIGFKANQY